MKNIKSASIILFLFYVTALILYHIIGYIGYFGYDDIHYALLSVDLTNGIINFNDHFSYRFPVILFTAFSYYIFGISDAASALPPLLATILILLLVFISLKNKSILTQWLGLSLTLFSQWFIFYSDKIMPDVYVGLSVLLSLFIIHSYKFGSKRNPAIYATLLSLSLLFGFMAKGTIVLFLPLLIYFAVVDIILKRDKIFWIYFIITGIITLAIYFLLIRILTGDITKRFEAIVSNGYLNRCSYNQQPLKILLRRISYDFIRLLTYQGMLTGTIFVFVYIIRNKVRNYFRFNDSFSFWLVSAAILFLSSNFMSISFMSYSPMCLDPRHYLFLTPVIAIPASIIVKRIFKSKKYLIPLILTLGTTSVVAFFLPGNTFYNLYLPLTVLFILYSFVPKKKKYCLFFISVFSFILALIPFKYVIYAKGVNYKKQREILTSQILEKYDDCYVITDEVQKNIGNYYNNFDTGYNATFWVFDEFSPDSLGNKKALLYLNWYTQYLSNTSHSDLPYFARNINPENPLIYENKKLQISIYEVNKMLVPSHNGMEILHSENNFEQPVPYWHQNEEEIMEGIKYKGNRSIQVNEYSSTFSYPLDSLDLHKFNKIVISSNVYCNFFDETNASLVISIENESGAYIWKGLKIDKYIKAYSNWWPVNFEIEANTAEIKPGSQLKVFVWNTDKNTAYIDNFNIEIFGMDE